MLSAQTGDASFEQTAGKKLKKEMQNTKEEPAHSRCTYECVRNRKIKGDSKYTRQFILLSYAVMRFKVTPLIANLNVPLYYFNFFGNAL